ncbi:hypothetical protein MKL09_28200 [Methylobacterium sp. J-048]|uniref:hypothetical protein n=1 Tax=Methylobacterium sp. J-048 TaxID=2836635 RepID=UPI001FB8C0E1|nr:hypothetical protein [Methylobacterium sp. J-048]MCJ2060395.1 hypothetical protein [Methylobacterium sp. J-048]
MNAFDRRETETDAAFPPQDIPEPAALWAAIRADLRARDERTARLRAMRLIAGDDEAA